MQTVDLASEHYLPSMDVYPSNALKKIKSGALHGKMKILFCYSGVVVEDSGILFTTWELFNVHLELSTCLFLHFAVTETQLPGLNLRP